jgi:hypothetical protein
MRAMMGPAMLITVGLLSQLDEINVAGFDRTWPVILLMVGVVKLLQSNASTAGHVEYVAPAPGAVPPGTGAGAATPQQTPVESPSGEVRNV